MTKKEAIENNPVIDIFRKCQNLNKKEENKMLRKFEYVERVKSTGYEMKEPDFDLPKRSTKKSGGYDFICPEDTFVAGKGAVTYVKTGIKAYFPDDEILVLANRSSNPKKKELVLMNGIGIVDSDYVDNPDNEGEICFAFSSLNETGTFIKAGEKLGQGVFMKYGITDDDNAEGERIGGWGSTGK